MPDELPPPMGDAPDCPDEYKAEHFRALQPLFDGTVTVPLPELKDCECPGQENFRDERSRGIQKVRSNSGSLLTCMMATATTS
jgi:hypothetical protein